MQLLAISILRWRPTVCYTFGPRDRTGGIGQLSGARFMHPARRRAPGVALAEQGAEQQQARECGDPITRLV